MVEIKPLNKDLIHRANYNSAGRKRGDLEESAYLDCAKRIISWPVSESKQQKLLDTLYKKFMLSLGYQANHVSVIVAGPSNYNAKRLDKSDQIIKTGADIHTWFSDLEDQVKRFRNCEERDGRDLKRTIHLMAKCNLDCPSLLPKYLEELAHRDPNLFIGHYEQLQPRYKWRGNTKVARLYQAALAGEIQVLRRERLFQDENFEVYKRGNRIFLNFIFEPKRQLKIAMKARKIVWNAYEGAYGTPLEHYDPEWVASISTRYENYI